MKDFFLSMTFWNWLSLIGFLVLPFTALNLYFNLKPRFVAWRSANSKKSFQSTLKSFQKMLDLVQAYKTAPANLLIDSILRLIPIGVGFLLLEFYRAAIGAFIP